MSETKIEQYERLKREQNPWQELPRLLEALRGGVAALAPEDLNTRLRWWGLYTQGDGAGAFGGAAPYFMLRIRIPNGLMSAVQAAAVAGLAQQHGRGLVDVTVRQNLQLHWLEAEALPGIFARLAAVGLSSQSACGDDPRNLTGCPLAGLDPDEYADASGLVLAANRALLAGGEFYNLPRKFKVCISGCREWCPNPEINDVALTALPPGAAGEGEWYGLRVGGGLSTTPHLARALPVRVARGEVVEVVRAVAGLFRDCAELRQNRGQARLKFLFMRHGWSLERFRAELEQRLGFRLQDAAPAAAPEAAFRDHVGWHRQRQPGYWYAGLSVLRGRLSADQLAAVAEGAERWGGGEVRATAMQNLVVPHVTEGARPALEAHLAAWQLPVAASGFRRGTMSCTGKEFCKLAVTETKTYAATLVAELERRLPGFPLPVRIHLNGCPNSCGQHWVADVGLQGTRVKTAAGPADGFDVYLGGGLGEDARLARKTVGRVEATALADRLEALLRYFMAHHREGEDFRDFVARQEAGALAEVLGTLPQAEVLVRLREAVEEPA